MPELEEVSVADLESLGYKLIVEPKEQVRQPFETVSVEPEPEPETPFAHRVYPEATKEDFARWRTSAVGEKRRLIDLAIYLRPDGNLQMELDNLVNEVTHEATLGHDISEKVEVIANMQQRLKDIEVRLPYAERFEKDLTAEAEDYSDRIELLEAEMDEAYRSGLMRKHARIENNIKGLKQERSKLESELQSRAQEEFRLSSLYDLAWDKLNKSGAEKTLFNFNTALAEVDASIKQRTDIQRFPELVEMAVKNAAAKQARPGQDEPIVDATPQDTISYG